MQNEACSGGGTFVSSSYSISGWAKLGTTFFIYEQV